MKNGKKTYFRVCLVTYDDSDESEMFAEYIDGTKIDPELQIVMGEALIEQAETHEYVYIGMSLNSDQKGYKIGKTNNIRRRERELNMKVIHSIECDAWGDCSAVALESLLHKLYTYSDLKISGEWYDLTEWDIELLRVFLGRDLDFVAKRDIFRAFQYAINNLQVAYNRVNDEKLHSSLIYFAKIWRDYPNHGTKILVSYVTRMLYLKNRVPESIFRAAIENTIFVQKEARSGAPLSPLEKSFSQTVSEFVLA